MKMQGIIHIIGTAMVLGGVALSFADGKTAVGLFIIGSVIVFVNRKIGEARKW